MKEGGKAVIFSQERGEKSSEGSSPKRPGEGLRSYGKDEGPIKRGGEARQ